MPMPSDAGSTRLSKSLLEAAIKELEQEAGEGCFNTLCLRSVGSAALILGQQAIADRAHLLLRTAPDEALWAGAVTNMNFSAVVLERLRMAVTTSDVEERHPPCRVEEIIERIQSDSAREKHLALCLQGRFDEARDMARSGLCLEEVGEMLAVLGEFDAARRIAIDAGLEAFRQQGVEFVLVIELYRRGRVEEALSLLAVLESAGLGAWSRVHLALGFAGRESWGGYPFPDW